MSFHQYIIFIIFLATSWTCYKQPEYPIEPRIELIGISKNELNQDFANTDSLIIQIKFEDGDGDISGTDNMQNIFLVDSRTGLESTYRIPKLPNIENGKGISGEINLVAYTTCCIFSNGHPPCSPSTEMPLDTLQYSIYLLDRAMHKSNIIKTPPIYLHCN